MPTQRPARTLVIQIPSFNEEATLAATLADLPRAVPGFDAVEWLVIDDGSTDSTSHVAHEHGVDHVVRLPENRGLANAFRTGLDVALRLGADVIVNTDADNQYRGACVADLVAPILSGDADVVVGERPIEQVEDFSPLKKRLQRSGSSVVRWFSRTDVADAASGFRAFSREAALRTQVHGRYSYTIETVIQAGWEGLRLRSVPIEVNPATRPSKLVRGIPNYLAHSCHAMIRSFALYKPFRFFMILGMVPFIAAVLLGTRWLYYDLFTVPGGRVPSVVAAAVCLILAFQLWVFGFIADLLSVNRRLISDIQVRLRRADLDGVTCPSCAVGAELAATRDATPAPGAGRQVRHLAEHARRA